MDSSVLLFRMEWLRSTFGSENGAAPFFASFVE
jgi:hypothetical protein